MRGKVSKSENGEPTPPTTFKIRDKYRFALHIVARAHGQSYTQVLEDAIDELARTQSGLSVSWMQLFDVEPGVRMLNLFAQPQYKPSPKEEDLISLIRATPQWWYSDEAQTTPRRDFVTILWPHREKYAKLWLNKNRNYWGAVEAMAADMRKARPDVKLPKWGDK